MSAFLLILGVLGIVGFVVLSKRPDPSPTGTAGLPAPLELLRSELELVGKQLHRAGDTNAFTGLMLDRYPGGSLQSRSMVSNGLLHGLSEGWHTNGQMQVSEQFKEGVSHGLRTKWHSNGTKLSEVPIVDGKLQGTFRRWSEKGALLEQVEFVEGQPDGVALAYFESGAMKSRTTLKSGSVVEQQSWPERK